MRVAEMSAQWRGDRTHPKFAVTFQWKLADVLVYRKIRAVWAAVSALSVPAALRFSKELAEFFWAVGIPIYQGYGLTETSPIVSSNYPDNRMGSSGKPIPDVQVRVAEDGEILVKGPCVMQGYYKNPEATREVLSEDGWFRTGDIGHLDKDNYLFINRPQKRLDQDGGRQIRCPAAHRNALKTSPYILNAMVLGDKRKFIVALIVPNPTTVSAKAADQGIKFPPTPNSQAHPGCTRSSTPRSSALRPSRAVRNYQRFALLPEDFTFDNGSLTSPSSSSAASSNNSTPPSSNPSTPT